MVKKIVAILISSVFLFGCAGKQSETRYTTTETDLDTNKVTKTEPVQSDSEEIGLFESGNLYRFYRYKEKTADKYYEFAIRKIEYIQTNSTNMMDNAETKLEKALIQLNAVLMISMIPGTPPQDGLQAPKTMADTWGSPLGYLQFGLSAWQMWMTYKNGNGNNDSPTINNDGGIVFYQSDNNMNQNGENGVSSYTLGYNWQNNQSWDSSRYTNFQ